MSLTMDMSANIAGTLLKANDFNDLKHSINENYRKSFAAGVASGQVDRVFAVESTLAGSAGEDWDLAGSMTDVFGDALAFVKVRGIYIKADDANTNTVDIGGDAAAFLAGFGAVNDLWKIPKGGLLMATHPLAGWTVTATTGDILQVTNGAAGTDVTYRMVIIGSSA